MARPGGRTARIRDAVRRATLAELLEKGYHGMTVDAVAARSGVHRTTVYRRWASVAGLVTDALELAATEPWPVPDTGDLAADLRSLVRMVVDHFAEPAAGAVSTAFLAAALADPVAARALRAFFASRHDAAAGPVRRAVDRGELPAGTDPAELVRAAVAPVYYRLLVSREPVDVALADRAAAAAVAAAVAGVFVRPGAGG